MKGGVLDQPLGRISLDVFRRRRTSCTPRLRARPPPAAGRGGRGAAAATRLGAGGGVRGAAAGGAGRQGGRGAQGPNAEPTRSTAPTTAVRPGRRSTTPAPARCISSKVRIDPNDPEAVYLAGIGLRQTLDGGQTIGSDAAASTHDDVHAIWVDPVHSAAHRDREQRRARGVVGQRPAVAGLTEPAGRALLSREHRRRRTRSISAAACRTTTTGVARSAVRSSTGIAGLPQMNAARAATDSSSSGSGRLRHHIHRVAGPQHRPRRSRDSRDDEHPAGRRASRTCGALALGHAADVLAARSENRLRRRQPVLPFKRRGLSWTAISLDRRRARPATRSKRWG